MIEAIKSWIVNISTVIIFITAVELILPQNSIKKYAKYVLGLLVVLTMINPMLKFFNKDYNLKEYSIKTEDYFQSQKYKKDLEKYKKINREKTIETFKENVALQCKERLKTYYKDENFDVDVKVNLDQEHSKLTINSIDVGVYEGKVKKIKPVIINSTKESAVIKENINKEKANSIKGIVEKEFGIQREKIKVYSLDN